MPITQELNVSFVAPEAIEVVNHFVSYWKEKENLTIGTKMVFSYCQNKKGSGCVKLCSEFPARVSLDGTGKCIILCLSKFLQKSDLDKLAKIISNKLTYMSVVDTAKKTFYVMRGKETQHKGRNTFVGIGDVDSDRVIFSVCYSADSVDDMVDELFASEDEEMDSMETAQIISPTTTEEDDEDDDVPIAELLRRKMNK